MGEGWFGAQPQADPFQTTSPPGALGFGRAVLATRRASSRGPESSCREPGRGEQLEALAAFGGGGSRVFSRPCWGLALPCPCITLSRDSPSGQGTGDEESDLGGKQWVDGELDGPGAACPCLVSPGGHPVVCAVPHISVPFHGTRQRFELLLWILNLVVPGVAS